MLPELERQTRLHPRGVCFSFEGRTFVHAQVRLQAAGLARALQLQGVRRGSMVACDMENCPAFALLIVAAAYGGFTLVTLNHRLTDAEKAERLADLERSGCRIMTDLDEKTVVAMLHDVSEDRARQALRHHAERFAAQFSFDERAVVMFTSGTSGRAKAVALTWRNLCESAQASNRHIGSTHGVDVWQLALPLYHVGGFQILVRSIMGASPFVLYRRFDACRVLEDAERYSATHISVVDKMLQDLLAVSVEEAEDDEPAVRGRHAAAVSPAARSLDAASFPDRAPSPSDDRASSEGRPVHGRHAARARALHARVEDEAAISRYQDCKSAGSALAGYRCILLGGAAPNPKTLERAVAAGARVFASYGMTETASQIASTLVTESFDGTLDLLPGYEATVIAPDAQGMGQLAVSGPGVFGDYLNANAAFTADGFFLTGDRACVEGRRLRVAERTGDMFVSGGENVYPAEIQKKLLLVPGVTDAYVFGEPDPVWGRRPVAIVERSPRAVRQAAQKVVLRSIDQAARRSREELADSLVRPGLLEAGRDPRWENARDAAGATSPGEPASAAQRALADRRLAEGSSCLEFVAGVRAELERSLSRIYRPDQVMVVEEFPRTGIGKVDRASLARMWDERIQIRKVELIRVRQPFVRPVVTAKTRLEERESLFVRVTDHKGRTGIGEGVAFDTDWYLPETSGEDWAVLRNELIPRLLEGVFSHPSQVFDALADCPNALSHPLACGALEPAVWDLYGKIVRRPLWKLVGGECEEPPAFAEGGAVFGIMPPEELAEAAKRAVDAGFRRVKIKVEPGSDVDSVRAVREACPDAVIMVDANQSYPDSAVAKKAFEAFAEAGVRCVEEPLAVREGESKAEFFGRLSRLQEFVDVDVCLDESVVTHDDLREALAWPKLRCYAVKIAKFGGITPALSFCNWARRHGVDVWMGGMYDTGVSKRMHAAFCTLPGVDIPGDLSDTSRYFAKDVTTPPFALERGKVELSGVGLGCELDDAVLDEIAVERAVFERQA